MATLIGKTMYWVRYDGHYILHEVVVVRKHKRAGAFHVKSRTDSKNYEVFGELLYDDIMDAAACVASNNALLKSFPLKAV